VLALDGLPQVAVAQLLQSPAVDYASVVLVNQQGQEIGGFTDRILVRVKAKTSQAQLATALAALPISRIDPYPYNPETFVLTLAHPAQAAVWEQVQALERTKLFVWVEPNYVLFAKLASDPSQEPFWETSGTCATMASLSAARPMQLAPSDPISG
jgi:hypothetical protein